MGLIYEIAKFTYAYLENNWINNEVKIVLLNYYLSV
jgi:hypothetical protein